MEDRLSPIDRFLSGRYAAAAVVATVVVVAGATAIVLYARTPTPIRTVDAARTPPVVSSSADSSPVSSPAVPSPSPAASQPLSSRGSCALPKYPTPACTGVPAGTKLTTHTGSLVIKSPGIYENMLVTAGVSICADNVTFRNSVVYAGGAVMAVNTRDWPCDSSQHRHGVLIEDVTIKPTNFDLPTTNWARYKDTVALGNDGWPTIGIGPSGFTCLRCQIITRDGPRIGGVGYDEPGGATADILIQDSYIFARSDGYQEPCNHTDGVQGYGGGKNAVIRHTTIDSGKVCPTGAVFMGDNSTSIGVYDSLLMGGNYSLFLGDDPGLVADYRIQNVKIVDKGWGYGPSTCPKNAINNVHLWQNVTVVTIDPLYNVTGTVRTIATCGA